MPRRSTSAKKASRPATAKTVGKALKSVLKHPGRAHTPAPRSIKKAAHKVARTITGHGDYKPSRFKRLAGRGDYFSDLGGALGHGLGSAAGGIIGGGLSSLGGLLGRGDYYKSHGPRSNSIWRHPRKTTHSAAGAAPSESPFTMGAMQVQFSAGPPVVTHREFIGPVLSAGKGFNTKAYRIQPGLRGSDVLFPWGSSVANCFQQYEMRGMVLEYVTTSSNFAAESALGTVMMSTLYDANAQPLASQVEVDNNDFTTTTVPSASLYHPIECATKESPVTVRYVRSSNSAASFTTDDRLDDVGVFQLSTYGLSAEVGTQIGELWCTYEIHFLKAALPDLHAGTAFVVNGASIGNGGLLDVATAEYNPSNSLPATVSPTVPGRLILPVGYSGSFQLTLTVVGYLPTPFDLTTGMVLTHGTNITPLMLLPGRAETAPPGGPTVDDVDWSVQAFGHTDNQDVPVPSQDMYTITALFSTIAEDLEDNWLQFGSSLVNPTSAQPNRVCIVITAVDSDIASSATMLSREIARVSRDPRLQSLLSRALLSVPSASASSSGPSMGPAAAAAASVEAARPRHVLAEYTTPDGDELVLVSKPRK